MQKFSVKCCMTATICVKIKEHSTTESEKKKIKFHCCVAREINYKLIFIATARETFLLGRLYTIQQILYILKC